MYCRKCAKVNIIFQQAVGVRPPPYAPALSSLCRRRSA